MKSLFEQIKDGEIDNIRELIKSSPDVLNSVSPKNVNPLSYAIVTEQVEILNLLLDSMNSHQINMSGAFHPLSLAIQYQDEKAIDTLLFSGKMEQNPLAENFIIDAYNAKSSTDTINKLSTAGFKYTDKYMGYNVFSHLFNFPENHEQLLQIPHEELKSCITPEALNVLIESNIKPEHIKIIMDASIDISDDIKDTVFQRACESLNINSVKSLLDLPGFYPNKSSRDSLITLVINFDNESKTEITKEKSKEDYESYKYLKSFIMDNQFSIHDYQHPQGDTVLNLAIIKNDNELFDYFLSKGADINEENGMGNNALLTALTYRQGDFFDKVMLESPNLKTSNKAKNTALILAAETCNNYALDILAAQIGFKEDRNQDGYTAMHISILNKNANAISTLLWHNASIASSPLVIHKKNTSTIIEDDLAQEEHLEDDIIVFNSFKQLAYHGFNPNQINEEGNSFPHHFIKHGSTANLLSIIELNIDPNILNQNNENILMLSAKSNNTIMFNAILEKFKDTIDLSQVNNEGKDIYTILQERKDINRISDLLLIDSRFATSDKDMKKTLSNVLPMITFAGDITPHIPLIREWSKKNGPVIDRLGNSLLVAGMASGKVETFKILSEEFSHHIFIENKQGESGLSFLKKIAVKNKEVFQEYLDNLSKQLGKNFLNLDENINQIEINLSHKISDSIVNSTNDSVIKFKK